MRLNVCCACWLFAIVLCSVCVGQGARPIELIRLDGLATVPGDPSGRFELADVTGLLVAPGEPLFLGAAEIRLLRRLPAVLRANEGEIDPIAGTFALRWAAQAEAPVFNSGGDEVGTFRVETLLPEEGAFDPLAGTFTSISTRPGQGRGVLENAAGFVILRWGNCPITNINGGGGSQISPRIFAGEFLPGVGPELTVTIPPELGGGELLADLTGSFRFLFKPVLAQPERFRVERFVDLSQLGGFLKAFQLSLKSDDTGGFPPGLYITSGPLLGPESDRLLRVNPDGTIDIVAEGLSSNESIVFGGGAFGAGMLVTQPRTTSIIRLFPDGTSETFSQLGTPPFGPAIMERDGPLLYVSDFLGGQLLRVFPGGGFEVVTSVPLPPADVAGFKDVAQPNAFAGDLLLGVFTAQGPNPTGLGTLYRYNLTSGLLTPVLEGLDGLELTAEGPGGPLFGSDIYVPTQGTDISADGEIVILGPDSITEPFMSAIDAASIAFDPTGVVGGGMYIADFNNGWDPATMTPFPAAGYVWRVRRAPCYADCDGSGALDIFDFLCFQNAFSTGDFYADCDDDGQLNIFDFLCFQNAFVTGCP